VGLDLTLDDFQDISDKVPFIADLKPSGKYVMEDLHKVGGVPAVLKYLLEKGLIDGSCITGSFLTFCWICNAGAL
jgi:dihydroxy-acid dehydratase